MAINTIEIELRPDNLFHWYQWGSGSDPNDAAGIYSTYPCPALPCPVYVNKHNGNSSLHQFGQIGNR